MENKIILIEDDEKIREMINDYLSGEFEVINNHFWSCCDIYTFDYWNEWSECSVRNGWSGDGDWS